MKEETTQSIFDVINYFDSLKKPISEALILNKIREEAKPIDHNQIEELAESMAFGFSENYKNKEYSWGTYYGPRFLEDNEDGTITESPSIQFINAEVLNYWGKRAEEATNPFLKAKYADLVFDFCTKITGKQFDYKLGLIVIENNIEIAKRKLCKDNHSIIVKLRRALEIALMINNKKLIKEIKDKIIEFQKENMEDDKPNSWVYAYDTYLNFERKNVFSEDEISNFINDFEDRLNKISKEEESPDKKSFFIEIIGLRLSEYYKKKNDEINLLRVTQFIEKVSLEYSSDIFSLEKIHKMYAGFNLGSEAARILTLIQQDNPNFKENLHTITTKHEFNVSEFQKFIEEEVLSGEIEHVIAKICHYFTPDKDALENNLRNMVKKAPQMFIFNRSSRTEYGRKIAEIKPIDVDPDGHIIDQVVFDLSFQAPILNNALNGFITNFEITDKKLLDIISQSPLFIKNREQLICRGIMAYFQKDYITAVHLLVPQIENSFRQILKLSGQPIYKPNLYDGFNYITLRNVLDSEIIESIFDEGTVLYFKTLLVEPRGINIRNDVAHGIISAEFFDFHKADRLIHILLILSQLKSK